MPIIPRDIFLYFYLFSPVFSIKVINESVSILNLQAPLQEEQRTARERKTNGLHVRT